MRLKPAELASALAKGLAPLYLLTGSEPLQLGEAADAIRLAARQSGFDTREILSVDAHFSWRSLLEEAATMSIFSDKKIIDLRIPDGKLGSEGAKALLQYCELKPEDTLLLMSAGKLAAEATKSRWYLAVEQWGVVVQVKELDGTDLLQWLQQRAHRRGMHMDAQAIKFLASRIEGNLLAAAQEIEKLYVLFGTQPIGLADLQEVVADHARYDVFKLVDSLLAGKVKRSAKILNGLRDEGIAAPVVLWALAREARILWNIRDQVQQRVARDMIFKNLRIWDADKKASLSKLIPRLDSRVLGEMLRLSAQADAQIKGQRSGNPWETMLQICLLFA
jgi:DNA polymerase III subunit delta